MNQKNLQLNQAYKVTCKSIQMIDEVSGLPDIQNYYGAHKNFKTQFRNKRYKHVYQALIHRKPAQEEYIPLFYQDLLISVIKSIENAIISKQVKQSIEPFFNFGKKAIKQFYHLFLKEVSIIKKTFEIKNSMKNKITFFLTLVIDFSSKISLCLKKRGDLVNACRIYQYVYQKIVNPVLHSSTSNIRLLRKSVQFLNGFATIQMQMDRYDLAINYLKEAMRVELNQLFLISFDVKRKITDNKKQLKKYANGIRMLSMIFLNYGACIEQKTQLRECQKIVRDSSLLGEVIHAINPKQKNIFKQMRQLWEKYSISELELERIANSYFYRSDLTRLIQVPLNFKLSPPSLNQEQQQNPLSNRLAIRRGQKHRQKEEKEFVYFVKKENSAQKKSPQKHQSIRSIPALSEKTEDANQDIDNCNRDMNCLLYGTNLFNRRNEIKKKKSKSSGCFSNFGFKSQKDDENKKNRLSYDGKNYIDAKSKMSKQNKNQGAGAERFLRNNLHRTTLRKKKLQKNELYVVKKKQKKHHSYMAVEKNIAHWHRCQQQYRKELFQDKFKLKQQKHTNQLQNLPNFHELSSFEKAEPDQILINSKLEKEIADQCGHKNKKMTGVQLFKSIILKHKKYLDINLSECFQSLNEGREKNQEIYYQGQNMQFIREKAFDDAERNLEMHLKEYKEILKIEEKKRIDELPETEKEILTKKMLVEKKCSTGLPKLLMSSLDSQIKGAVSFMF